MKFVQQFCCCVFLSKKFTIQKICNEVFTVNIFIKLSVQTFIKVKN